VTTAEAAEAVRRCGGWFRLVERGVLAVSGADRRRWLNGMLTNDVARLHPGASASGCYALLLTSQGRIVADLHVLAVGEEFWLECERRFIPKVKAQLARYIVADAVELADRSAELLRYAVEGARAPELLRALNPAAPELAADACASFEVATVPYVVAAFGFSGAPAFQFFVPAEHAVSFELEISRAAGTLQFLRARPEALEILRIESGSPRLGYELGEEVLPPEAHLERALSTTKGCYTGQEVVARLASRGQVKHELVGLQFPSGELPDLPCSLEVEGRRVGELTSATHSLRLGAIALAFVRREFAQPGSMLTAGGRAAVVRALPQTASAPMSSAVL